MSKKAEKPKLKEDEAETEEVDMEEAEEVIEKKPKKLEKPKPEKKKKKEKGIFSCYKIDEKSLTRLRPFCERCGPGYFMADHGTRYTCGHCGFTRYKQSQQ